MPATIAQFRAALPAFTALLAPDETVQIYLDMAERDLGDGLGTIANDAQIFLTAHLMSLAGIGPGSKAGEMAGFTTIKAGSLTLTRSERAAAGEYASTQYGALYWRLVGGRLGSGIMVTGTGSLPGYFPYTHGQD